MQTSLNQLSPVEYELVIDATAADLAPQINKKLRQQRASISLKGFRPGKVPLPLLKKMYGESLVVDVIEKIVMEIFSDEIIEPKELRVIGLPRLSTLDYKLDGDLHAVLKFGVQPEFDIKDLSSEVILKLTYDVTDEDIDSQIQHMLRREADLRTREEEETVTETDYVVIDMQQLDDTSATPIIGKKEEDLSFFLDDDNLRDDLREVLIGKKAGDRFKVSLAVEDAPPTNPASDAPKSDLLVLPNQAEQDESEKELYEVHIRDVQERILPELDEEFIKEQTRDEAEDEDSLKAFIRKELERLWDEESRKLMESEIAAKMLELHDFPVPDPAIDIFLSTFIDDLRSRNNDKLPEGFDYDTFREARKNDAEQLARWSMIRDKVAEEESLDVDDDDRRAYLARQTGSEDTVDALLSYYKSMQNDLMDRLDQQLLESKVFEQLARRFTVEEKTKDEYTDTLKERSAAREALKI